MKQWSPVLIVALAAGVFCLGFFVSRLPAPIEVPTVLGGKRLKPVCVVPPVPGPEPSLVTRGSQLPPPEAEELRERIARLEKALEEARACCGKKEPQTRKEK